MVSDRRFGIGQPNRLLSRMSYARSPLHMPSATRRRRPIGAGTCSTSGASSWPRGPRSARRGANDMTDKLARTARRSHVANDWLRPFLSDTGLGAVRDLYPTAACEHDAAALFASISKQLGKDEARRIFSDLLVRPAGRKPLDGGKTTRKDAA